MTKCFSVIFFFSILSDPSDLADDLSFMGGGRIFYIGGKWGQSPGLGGGRQRRIDTVEH